ncbi:MAG TPA: Holliday junction branch migration protein RuvA [Pseudomonadales bacterium]|nr:Holliday junction branch migration protein RuvA [Pseudomonadales bacterium]
MIGRIHGIILEKQAPEVLIKAHGVGYEVQAPLSTFYRLPPVGQEVVLHTHFVVREDAQQLYGFWHRDDRSLFRALIRVSGVGPKLALAILSGMDAEEFARCVQRNDASALVKLPGVGKKTAERLMIEMRDVLREWRPDLALAKGEAPAPDIAEVSRNRLVQDAESALIALGYKPQEAARAVSAALDEDVRESEELIRRALKGFASAR